MRVITEFSFKSTYTCRHGVKQFVHEVISFANKINIFLGWCFLFLFLFFTEIGRGRGERCVFVNMLIFRAPNPQRLNAIKFLGQLFQVGGYQISVWWLSTMLVML